MTYIITTKIRSFSYYVKITYEGARYPEFRWEGLKNNASEFPDEESAKIKLRQISERTQHTLRVIEI